MIDDDYLDEDFYNGKDESEEENEFSGFSIVDESGLDINEIKKIVKDAEEDEPAIATPIPENEQIVIVDNAGLLIPDAGEKLDIKISKVAGSVFYKKMKVGDFKPAFLARLYETREGSFVKAFLHSNEAPVMVKLIFSSDNDNGAVKIE